MKSPQLTAVQLSFLAKFRLLLPEASLSGAISTWWSIWTHLRKTISLFFIDSRTRFTTILKDHADMIKKDLCILDQISVLLFYYSTVISFVSENFFFFVKYTARKIRKGVFLLTSFFWYIFVSNSFVAMAVREFSFSLSCWMEITLMLFTTKGNFFL